MMNIFEKNEPRVTCSPFADGYMGQNPMDEQARRSLEQQYSQTFGKHLSDKDGGDKFSEEERLRRERAKKANRIYKKVCEDLQLNACFFSNFGEWSEYVEGKMSDAEFHGHAIERAIPLPARQRPDRIIRSFRLAHSNRPRFGSRARLRRSGKSRRSHRFARRHGNAVQQYSA